MPSRDWQNYRENYDDRNENQWCPSGLIKSQKRRVQRLRCREIEKEKNQDVDKTRTWRVKQKTDEGRPSAPINMVFLLPAEFRAYSNEDLDEPKETKAAMAQLTLQPQQAVFDKPKKHQHLKPLYVKGYVVGKPMTKMLVDGGAAVNLLPYTTYQNLGKGPEDLIKTDMMLRDLGGNASQSRGIKS